MKRLATVVALLGTALAAPASAWGSEGHEIVADIARAELTPAVRAKVDAMLATDTSDLTGHDIASAATWADAWRSHGGGATAQWHYVDIEIDGSADQVTACAGGPGLAGPASTGPARDCVVHKIEQFEAELRSPRTAPAERLMALKFLLHFVGDVHQPLHASDNHDRGGNCVLLALGGARTRNLHSFWDTTAVEEIGHDPAGVARELRARITPVQRASWSAGGPRQWADEAFAASRRAAYVLGTAPGCGDRAPIPLPSDYADRARGVAALQLERAGVRLGVLLNRALANVDVRTSVAPATASTAFSGRSAASLRCSTRADARDLHGAPRRRFRRGCLRDAGASASVI